MNSQFQKFNPDLEQVRRSYPWDTQ